MRKALLRLIDFFYPPFSRWLSLHTFRYLVSGGTTAASGIVVYYIVYNWVLHQEDVKLSIPYLPNLITAPVAALAIESLITFCIGFILNKYLIFTKSNLKGRIQLFRYGSVFVTNILLNLAMLKVLVEAFGFYPTISKIIITVILTIFSYFSQKYFTFKVRK
ncbi:GtrA family protein [Pedobacter steynii]|uniref:Phenylalanine 4-monooxygenase n=1 Tax=Pedobacter steynii TaxID=430522 RepID=A0A1D7QFV4_9SPHI|nr:GtrA family protein [Pedobacter steynii]AOM77541.1 phenylalanine 4-monooxygenase [Pedobacter steynii]